MQDEDEARRLAEGGVILPAGYWFARGAVANAETCRLVPGPPQLGRR
jgi:hypothetical protein